jgi:hypothetical protein
MGGPASPGLGGFPAVHELAKTVARKVAPATPTFLQAGVPESGARSARDRHNPKAAPIQISCGPARAGTVVTTLRDTLNPETAPHERTNQAAPRRPAWVDFLPFAHLQKNEHAKLRHTDIPAGRRNPNPVRILRWTDTFPKLRQSKFDAARRVLGPARQLCGTR